MAFLLDDNLTLQDQAKQYLVEEIKKGVLRPGKHIPTVREISKRLDVSTTVTLRAIQNMRKEGWVEREDTGRHRVANKAIDLLIEKQNLQIGFFSRGKEHIRTNSYQAIFNHILQLSNRVGADLHCFLELDEASRSLPPSSFDIIVVSDWEPQKYRQTCKNGGVIIGLDTWRGIDADYIVHTDHFKGGELIGAYLHQKGYERVVYFDTINSNKATDERRLGFQKGWIEQGGLLKHIRILDVIPTLPEGQLLPSARERKVIQSMIEDHLQDSDLFFVFCDMWAVEFCSIVKEMGLQIPEEIALAGFDGKYEALVHEPKLTTVGQDFKQIAKVVLDIGVTNVINGDLPEGKEIRIKPKLLVGASA